MDAGLWTLVLDKVGALVGWIAKARERARAPKSRKLLRELSLQLDKGLTRDELVQRIGAMPKCPVPGNTPEERAERFLFESFACKWLEHGRRVERTVEVPIMRTDEYDREFIYDYETEPVFGPDVVRLSQLGREQCI